MKKLKKQSSKTLIVEQSYSRQRDVLSFDVPILSYLSM